jgi:hypothetical protein
MGETIDRHEGKEYQNYQEEFTMCWFASTDFNGEERPQCVTCCEKPENDYLSKK